jgi:HEXXH motif-containing protein
MNWFRPVISVTPSCQQRPNVDLHRATQRDDMLASPSSTLPPDPLRARAVELLTEGLLWLPGLAAELAAHEWAELRLRQKLTAETYSTDRIRASNPRVARATFAKVARPHTIGLEPLPILVEHPFGAERHYEALGLSFYSPGELEPADVERKLSLALRCLAQAPGITNGVFDLVRSIHLLRPPEPAYDVSHSDPDVPFSVFVSLPDEETVKGQLRLAEALLHEAMHLQLTLLEGHAPIVARPEASFYSPWKRALRPVQGIMHGLYVFGVIDAFFQAVENLPGSADVHHARKRRTEIAEEVMAIQAAGIAEELTEFGALLHRAIMARLG